MKCIQKLWIPSKLKIPFISIILTFISYPFNCCMTDSLLCYQSILQPVKSYLMQNDSSSIVSGVVLEDGEEIKADIVLSNATPKITFLDLLPKVNISVIQLSILSKHLGWYFTQKTNKYIFTRTHHVFAVKQLSLFCLSCFTFELFIVFGA